MASVPNLGAGSMSKAAASRVSSAAETEGAKAMALARVSLQAQRKVPVKFEDIMNLGELDPILEQQLKELESMFDFGSPKR